MSFRSISRTASLALAVAGALFAVGVSALVQACGGESETKDGTTGPADASSEGAAGGAGDSGAIDSGGEEAEADAPFHIIDAPVVDVVPQDDVTLDVIPAE